MIKNWGIDKQLLILSAYIFKRQIVNANESKKDALIETKDNVAYDGIFTKAKCTVFMEKTKEAKESQIAEFDMKYQEKVLKSTLGDSDTALIVTIIGESRVGKSQVMNRLAQKHTDGSHQRGQVNEVAQIFPEDDGEQSYTKGIWSYLQKDFAGTKHNVLLQDAEGVSNIYDDNHQNVKLNALSFITSDVLIYCLRNNPGQEALEVAEKMNTIMKSPTIGTKDKDTFERNKPFMIIIVNNCDSVNAFNNPFDIFDDIIKYDSSRKNKIEDFRSKFIDVKCVGIARKGEPKRGPYYQEEWDYLHELMVKGLNKKGALRKRTPKQICAQMKNTVDILRPLNVDFGDLNQAFIQQKFFIPELTKECDRIQEIIKNVREDIPCGNMIHFKEQLNTFADKLGNELGLKSHNWNRGKDKMVVNCLSVIDGFISKKKYWIKKREDSRMLKEIEKQFVGSTTSIGMILLKAGFTTAGVCVIASGPFLAKACIQAKNSFQNDESQTQN